MTLHPLVSSLARSNLHMQTKKDKNLLYSLVFDDDYISDSEEYQEDEGEQSKEEPNKQQTLENQEVYNYLTDPSFEDYFLNDSDYINKTFKNKPIQQKVEAKGKTNVKNISKANLGNKKNDKCFRKKPKNVFESNKNGNHQMCVNEIRSTSNRPIKRQPIITDVKSLKRPLLDWDDYYRLDTIHAFMDNLESKYPSICTTGSIGKSWEGRDLKILKISNSNASNTSVWIDAGIHAREWIAPATNTFVADFVARNFDQLPEFVTNKDWYFLPVMNPDGYEYSHTNDRMWRKNKAWHRGQCVGVDLNRNFSYGFGGRNSSENPLNSFYRGPEPFSEPESKAVRDMLLKTNIHFSVYLTMHSYGQVILFPYACEDHPCPGYVRLLEGATIMSRAIYDTSGNTYKVGLSKDVMYGASGTSNDFSYGEAGIPYCYLIELRSKEYKFRLPKNEIRETGEEILSSVLALMKFVDNYTPPRIGCHESDESDVESMYHSENELFRPSVEDW